MHRRSLLLACAALPLARAHAHVKGPHIQEPLPRKFDPRRDAAADLQQALALAQAQHKHVIVDVGGEWCAWCHILDRFIDAHAQVQQQLDAHYVWLKVNYSPQNRNEALLSRWPRIKGYPHLFVLDAEGRVLCSQPSAELEAGKDYDEAKFLAFLRQHQPVR